jgi:NADH-quinone oxidoreductase subunit J
MLGIEQIIFYFFSAVLLLAAILVVSVKNPVVAALSLVLAFFSSAALWLMLEAEFLAIVLIIVYVGAVMVLFLFVVMMLDINLLRLREGFIRYLPFGLAVAVLLIMMMVMVIGPDHFGLMAWHAPAKQAADYSNTAELGRVLYTDYFYPFEIAAVILLVAMVAAISLTLRRRAMTKRQSPDQQIAVKAKDRLKMVKMDAEKD